MLFRANSSAGFSLLEMLIVIAILTLVSIIAVPQLSRPSDSVRLQALVGDLRGAMRLTRAAAVAKGRDLVLLVDVDRRNFQSLVVAMKTYSPDLTVQMTVAEPERITASHGGFRFFADGSSTGGDLVVRGRDKEIKICLDWLTGRTQQGPPC
jgi:general secretion pathway protein H